MAENATVEKQDKKKDKPAGSGVFARFLRWIKSIFLELKRVTWPTFPQVVKQTGVVLGVVIFFLVILTGMDLGLGKLYELLTRGLSAGT